jgi:hypothetical protein
MARTRTTKKLAQRIDLNYFKRPTPLKRAKLWLSVIVPVLALLWIGARIASGDHRVYSSGRMSEPHAVLEKECGVCHLQQAGVFSSKATDNACLACHDGPVHHAVSVATKKQESCAECHTEHRGRINIAAPKSQMCAECHENLNENGGTSRYAAHIRSFEDGHPEFTAVRDGARDLDNIKLNHAIHMKAIRRGPNGPMVTLECGDCHRPTAADVNLAYADPNYRAATVSYKDSDEFLPIPAGGLKPAKAATGRERMAPVKFANACAACHSLAFDKRFDEGVPHDTPEVVHTFVVKKFQQYIATHPAEVRVVREPSRDLTGKPLPPEMRVLTPAQWVNERVADAEELLWRKTCNQCHTVAFSKAGAEAEARGAAPNGMLPTIAKANVTLLWMPHAKFDHDAHRGFACVSCHEKALTSTMSSDILVPGIATCKACHAPGLDHADSQCSECHTYHDWSKRKEVTPKFTLPGLQTGGR